MTRYLAPGWFTRRVFNPMVSGLTRAGVSVFGSRLLLVRGRTTGAWRRVPVNLLTVEGDQYLVAPRGETQWVRNLRSTASGELVVGRRHTPFDAVEVTDGATKVLVLRAYLKRWKFEVGVFFPDLSAESPDDVLMAAVPGYPVFAVTTR